MQPHVRRSFHLSKYNKFVIFLQHSPEISCKSSIVPNECLRHTAVRMSIPPYHTPLKHRFAFPCPYLRCISLEQGNRLLTANSRIKRGHARCAFIYPPISKALTGSISWSETSADKAEYRYFQEQMTREVAAACEGALSAGAQEVLVKDCALYGAQYHS